MDQQTQVSMCTFCPKLCRHVCPVSNAEPRETLIPQAKVALLGRLRSGETERSTAQVAAIYACTGCGACTEGTHTDRGAGGAVDAVRHNHVHTQQCRDGSMLREPVGKRSVQRG